MHLRRSRMVHLSVESQGQGGDMDGERTFQTERGIDQIDYPVVQERPESSLQTDYLFVSECLVTRKWH